MTATSTAPVSGASTFDSLGDIPSHWSTTRLRFVARVNPSRGEVAHLLPDTTVSFLPMEAISENGRLTLDQVRPIADVWQGYTYGRNGDVVVAKITPCFENGKGALLNGLTNGTAFGTTELHVLRAGERVLPEFLYLLTTTQHFRAMGAAAMYGAAGQQRVPENFIADYLVPLPSLPEQRAIAEYLDRETARIDALVERKRRLIGLLAEKRAALITRAVTRGLDPDAALKDSGVGWLGEVPGHWTVRRIKSLSSLVTSGSRGWAEHYSDDGALFVRIGNLSRTSTELRLDDVQRVTPPPGAEGARTRVRKGDVLVSITAYIGTIGVVSQDLGEAYVNQHIALVRPRPMTVDSRWLGYTLLSKLGQEQFRTLLYGGTKDGLGLEDVSNLWILCPHLCEQQAVVAYLDRETAKLDALVAKQRETIAKLGEYRTALIAAAVTGKIDVRGRFRRD